MTPKTWQNEWFQPHTSPKNERTGETSRKLPSEFGNTKTEETHQDDNLHTIGPCLDGFHPISSYVYHGHPAHPGQSTKMDPTVSENSVLGCL